MKFYTFNLLSFLLTFLFCHQSLGQALDSASRQTPLQQVLALYEEAIGNESHLYNGPQYVNYIKSYVKGHQFYRTNEEEDGGVYYDGTWYAPVPMRYDVVVDKIVLSHPASEFTLSLLNEKVKYFSLQNHTFIRLEKDSLNNSPLKTGFYDLLYDGNLQLLAKRSKSLQEQATRDGMAGHFNQINRYFIRKENTYYPVKDKRSVLKILSDKKKELQRYARTEKLKFGKNREKAILQLTRFYDMPKP